MGVIEDGLKARKECMYMRTPVCDEEAGKKMLDVKFQLELHAALTLNMPFPKPSTVWVSKQWKSRRIIMILQD